MSPRSPACGIVAAAIVFLGTQVEAFDCRSAYLEFKSFNTNTGAITGSGRYDFDVPFEEAFEVHTVVHMHIVVARPECSGSAMDADVPLTLKGRRVAGELALTESWEAYQARADMVCRFPPQYAEVRTQLPMPMNAGTRQLRIPERDGAEIDVVAPPPMTARLHYTLRLRPTVPVLKAALGDCPVTSDLLQRATDAAGGRELSIICDEKESEMDLDKNRVKLKYSSSRCHMLSALIQELSNAAQRSEVLAVRARANNGDLDRDSYVKAIEMAEFVGVRLQVRAIEDCGSKWACLTGELAYWQKATDFERYYDGLKRNRPDHPAGIGKDWDKHYGTIYQAKH